MPFIVGCFALGMPRVMLVLVWIFSNLLQTNYATILWPIAGLIFAPLTTLAYAYAHEKSGGNVSGFWLALVVVAVLLDLGLLRSGRRKKKD
jgi:O-antigen/teichoic acid export membrane protein